MTAQSLLGKRVSIYDGIRGEELYQTEMGPAGRRASDGVPLFEDFFCLPMTSLQSVSRRIRMYLGGSAADFPMLELCGWCLSFIGASQRDQEPD